MAHLGVQNMIDGRFFPDPQRHGYGGARVTVLPLNLLALIISYLDNTADLARVCSTCRVLYYMTLPQLYRNITLSSYDTIRYRGQLPEGCGSASPFTMGLNAIVTRHISYLVHSLTLRGEWREPDIEEHGKVGRVPDNSMMLNIVVRAAIDRTTALESFYWDLNTKMLHPVYGGLAARPTLKSLTIRMPSTRHPRPIVQIPPFPHLESLKLTHIDPLCYPDDVSNCLLHSPKIHTLKLHFSPRMRAESEPSTNLYHFFRKVAAHPKIKLKIKHLAYSNLFSNPISFEEIDSAFDPEVLESITILNSTWDEESGAPTFIDANWGQNKPHHNLKNLKSIRHDRLSAKYIEFFGQLPALERFYSVSAPPEVWPPNSSANAINQSFTITNGVTSSSGNTPSANYQSPNTPVTPTVASSISSLRDNFLKSLFTHHGANLQHVLLSSRWLLNVDMISRMVRSCPNLTQIGLAVDSKDLEFVRLILQFLPKLRAIRLLHNSDPSSIVNPTAPGESTTNGGGTGETEEGRDLWKASQKSKLMDLGAVGIEMIDDTVHLRLMGKILARDDGKEYPNLKYIGLGQKVFELGGMELVDEVIEDEDEVWSEGTSGERRVEKVWRRVVRRVPPERVAHIEIWKNDTMEI